MRKKITWQVIFEDFKVRHPRLSGQILHWRPYDYSTIVLYLNDGMKLLYNYDNHSAKMMTADK